MSEGFGISYGGKSAEDQFIALTGARKVPRAAMGDAVLEGRFVEVKSATSNTLNQVRAVKYIPLVVYETWSDSWYVVRAHVVILEVSRRNRGQHTENPFESATMNLKNLVRYRLEDKSLLREGTLAAIEESDRFPALHQLMEDILSDSKILAERSIIQVRQLLRDLEISDS